MAVTEAPFESSTAILAAINNGQAGTLTLSSTWKRSGTYSVKLECGATGTFGSALFQMTATGTNCNYRIRTYYMAPSSHFPSSSEAIGLLQGAPFYLQGFFLYGDGSIWFGTADTVDAIRLKNSGGTAYIQICPAGTITANTPFRFEYTQNSDATAGNAGIFTGSNLETTTATNTVALTNPGVMDYGGVTSTPYIMTGRFNTTTGNAVSTLVYVDDLAYEFSAATTTYIGPAAATTPTPVLNTTSTLTTTGNVLKTAASPNLTTGNTSILTVTGQRVAGPASVTLPIWHSTSVLVSGAYNAAFYFTTTASLVIGSTSIIKKDISELIVGATGSWSIGHVEIPQNRLDEPLILIVSNANCQNLDTWAVEVCLPKPLTPNVDHYCTIEYKIRDVSRRVFLSVARAYQELNTTFSGGLVRDYYGKVRVDGFVVEPGPAANSDAVVTYRWNASQQKWWIDTWSGTVNLIDHRPNEMPEDMGPCYFSPQTRARSEWLAIRDQHVDALKRLPYWVNRFMKENFYITDVVSGLSTGNSFSSLMWEGLGLRGNINPTDYQGALGTSVVPVSMGIAWCKILYGSNAANARVILHEIGHLFDYTGMAFAGKPHGYNPAPPESALDYGTVYVYYDPPTNLVIQSVSIYEPTTFGITYYNEAGDIIFSWGGYRDIAHITSEASVITMYNVAKALENGANNYYLSNIGEWVAQMLGIYFMRLDPTYVSESYYDGTPIGTEQNYQNFVAYMITINVLPALNTLINYSTLVAGSPAITRIASVPTLLNTKTLSAEAVVRIREILSGWGIVTSGHKP